MSETPASRKAAIWVVVLFLLGAIAGGMFGYGYAHRSVAAASAPMPEPERRAKRVEQLTKDLGLTPDQAKQLDAILIEWHGRLKAIRSEEHTTELQSRLHPVCRLLLEKKNSTCPFCRRSERCRH